MSDLSYKSYVYDDAHMASYSEYQTKYAKNIRESDKVLIEIVHELISKSPNEKNPTLLDVGCSTGNLLLHLKYALPHLKLFGGDIVSSIIQECNNNPSLEGIHFEEMDMLNLQLNETFDFVVTNAALMFFNNDEFNQAIHNLATITRVGGWFIAFDYFHSFQQEVTIIEESKLFPQGLKFHLRGYEGVEKTLTEAGFAHPIFKPFYIPIDLKQPDISSDITTYTVKTDEGNRLSFRGTLFQPWCYLIAQKAV